MLLNLNIEEYILITSNDLQKFIDLVNEHIEYEFQPYGNTFTHFTGIKMIFYQPMVKYKLKTYG